jgi:hypothetical protein
MKARDIARFGSLCLNNGRAEREADYFRPFKVNISIAFWVR